MSANKDRLALIEHLSSIGGEHSDDLRETLDRVAFAIASGMEAEVCSLYLFDPQRERLVLRATVGLDRESVGKVSMRLNEGLVGLVLEKDEPVYVPDAISHQRYKYFPETGEERFHTFLGVPVHDGRKKPLGVLVAQTLERRKFNKSEIRLLSTAANQVAQILSHFRLRESLVTKEKERLEYKRRMIEANRQLKDYEKVGGKTRHAAPAKIRRPRLAGLSASPGFAQGNAHVVGTFLSSVDRHQKSRDPKVESKRFEEALARSLSELATLRIRMQPLMPESDLKIFDGHRMILEDEEFVGRIRDTVANGYTAESALFRVIEELSASMLAVADNYLRERATDFRDVGHRVLRHLRQEEKRAPFSKPTIIVAEELTLSQLTMVNHDRLAGIALQSGGVTSHAAILARAFEIPTVVGVEHLMESVVEGDQLVLDGNAGVVYVNPSDEIERDYVSLSKRYEAFKKELIEEGNAPTATRDGRALRV